MSIPDTLHTPEQLPPVPLQELPPLEKRSILTLIGTDATGQIGFVRPYRPLLEHYTINQQKLDQEIATIETSRRQRHHLPLTYELAQVSEAHLAQNLLPDNLLIGLVPVFTVGVIGYPGKRFLVWDSWTEAEAHQKLPEDFEIIRNVLKCEYGDTFQVENPQVELISALWMYTFGRRAGITVIDMDGDGNNSSWPYQPPINEGWLLASPEESIQPVNL